MAEKNMPNTITFIPHRMRKRFARVNELASLMWRRDDTQEREISNLLVQVIPALILSEDEVGTELHKEHHSRVAGLNQRLAAAKHLFKGRFLVRLEMTKNGAEPGRSRTRNST